MKKKPKAFLVDMVPIKDLVHMPDNPRTMSDDDREGLNAILEKFGMVENIVVNSRNMHIVGGNQRVTSLRDMGATHVPVKFVDLEPDEEDELCVGLNKHSGKWDDKRLAIILNRVKDLKVTGFKEGEREGLLKRIEQRDQDSAKASESRLSSVPSVSPTVEFRFGDFRGQVPREVYENFVAEVSRIKAALWPKEDPENVSVIQPLEYIVANSANTPMELV